MTPADVLKEGLRFKQQAMPAGSFAHCNLDEMNFAETPTGELFEVISSLTPFEAIEEGDTLKTVVMVGDAIASLRGLGNLNAAEADAFSMLNASKDAGHELLMVAF